MKWFPNTPVCAVLTVCKHVDNITYLNLVPPNLLICGGCRPLSSLAFEFYCAGCCSFIARIHTRCILCKHRVRVGPNNYTKLLRFYLLPRSFLVCHIHCGIHMVLRKGKVRNSLAIIMYSWVKNTAKKPQLVVTYKLTS